MSEVGNNAIIAGCFHHQVPDLVFGCKMHLPRGVQAYVNKDKAAAKHRAVRGKHLLRRYTIDAPP
ncbi:MAG TPA: hypothetical protein VFZ02_07060, partial [Ktedonobacteraceae bacterium]